MVVNSDTSQKKPVFAFPCLLCHVPESDSCDSFNNLQPSSGNAERPFSERRSYSHMEISLHYVYLHYHLGLVTACVLLFYKPKMSQDSSRFPLVAPSVAQRGLRCVLHAALAAFTLSFSRCLWAPALKLCPLGWIPGTKPRHLPEDNGTSATSFSGLVTSWSRIQHSGIVLQWEVNPNCQLYTLFMQIHIQVQREEADQYLTIRRYYKTWILSSSVGLTQCFNSEYPN